MNSQERHPFINGVVMAIPIFVGYTALGIPFGLLGVKLGIPAWALVMMSVFILAGSAQFVAVQLIAQGADVTSIILAGFILNVRHFVMGMSLGSVLPRVRTPFLVYLAHSITDESFGVNIVKVKDKESLDPLDMLGTNLVAHVSWVMATLVGAYIGNSIPMKVEVASAALPVMFTVLLALQIKNLRSVVMAVSAATLTVVFMFFLPGNWSFIAAALIVPTVATIYEIKK